MSNNKRNGGIFGKGYYIALILCAAAIGITGYVYYRNTTREDLTIREPDYRETAPAAGTEHQDIPVLATQPPSESTAPTTEATKPTQTQPIKTAAPVSGETVSGYSMEALSYNQTTRDWRVHNGLDIAAQAGTEVCAAADGQVYTIYQDDILGTTVVVRHLGGYTTTYASLSQELAVKVGDTVTLGQVIGTVGETALTESTLGPHVHFSVTYQDIPMDPMEFLELN